MTGVNNAVNAPFGTNVQTILANNAAGSTSGGPASNLDGTFTPVLNFGGATTGIMYSSQIGTYTRIGNVVFFQIVIVLSSKGSATGAATVTGLPVTSRSGQGTSAFAMLGESITYTGNYLMATLPASSTTLALNFYTTATGGTAISNTGFANGSDFVITGHYLV